MKDCINCAHSWNKPSKSYPHGHCCGRLVREIENLPACVPKYVIPLMMELPKRCGSYKEEQLSEYSLVELLEQEQDGGA